MPRGRPRKTPDAPVTENKPEITDSGSETVTKRGRKPTPKDYPTCEFCGKPIVDGNPWQIRFNQLVGTGEYRFRAINTKPNLCRECYLRTVRALDNWLLKNGIPEKFVDGRGFREEDE